MKKTIFILSFLFCLSMATGQSKTNELHFHLGTTFSTPNQDALYGNSYSPGILLKPEYIIRNGRLGIGIGGQFYVSGQLDKTDFHKIMNIDDGSIAFDQEPKKASFGGFTNMYIQFIEYKDFSIFTKIGFGVGINNFEETIMAETESNTTVIIGQTSSIYFDVHPGIQLRYDLNEKVGLNLSYQWMFVSNPNNYKTVSMQGFSIQSNMNQVNNIYFDKQLTMGIYMKM